MKKHSLLTIALMIAVSICHLPSSILHAQLTYTVVTNGLNSINYEGGGTEIEAGDIDGDGDLDLVSIGDHGNPLINSQESGIMVWKNNGTGTSWSLNQTGSFGYGGVALGDVNNDGKLDIGYAQHHNYSGVDLGDQLIEVALGNGTGSSWTPYDNGLAANGETYGMSGIGFADIDNDGLLDLASNSMTCCAGIHAYKNNGDGTWKQTFGVVGGNGMNMSELGDFNRDGNTDWAVSSEIGNIWKNNGAGVFTHMQTGITQDWTMKFAVDDVNNDGATDIAVMSNMVASVPTTVKVYTYNTTLQTWQSISNGIPNPATGITRVLLADMDMDGYSDLLTWSADSVRILKGDGSGNWTPAGGFAKTETGLTGWGIGDFNHDGYNDVAVLGSTGTGTIFKVYLNVHTTQAPLTIQPLTPKGYECFAPGSVHIVKWLANVPSGPGALVSIDFSSSGSAGPWTSVAASLPNSGIYQWTVPAAVNSNNCFLKYTITSGSSSMTAILSNAFGIGTCTSATGTDEITDNIPHLSIYPNPFSTTTTLSVPDWNSKDNDRQLKIYDVLGSVVYQQSINTQVTTVSPALSAGVYFLEVNGTESTLKEKVVVVK